MTSKQTEAPVAITTEAGSQMVGAEEQAKSTTKDTGCQMDDPEVFRLETRYHPKTARFQIRIDGRWRQRRSWWDTCFNCWRKRGENVSLEYYGCLSEDGTTTFWSVCPECGDRSSNDWIGRPKERQDGGWQHGWLAQRRAGGGR